MEIFSDVAYIALKKDGDIFPALPSYIVSKRAKAVQKHKSEARL